MSQIPLWGKRGVIRGYAAVDDADEALANTRRWYWNKRGYAASDLTGSRVLLHRFLLSAPEGAEVDHRDGDKLNNRRENLRVSDRKGNGSNRSAQPFNTSGFKGVGWHKQSRRWRARIMVDHKDIFLGLYDSAAEAGKVYAEAAEKHFGEFANTRMAQ